MTEGIEMHTHELKHGNQQDKIVKYMDEGGLINIPNCLYVEFGAGKAGLSVYVAADLHEKKAE
jgi:hypothetical protein